MSQWKHDMANAANAVNRLALFLLLKLAGIFKGKHSSLSKISSIENENN